MDLHSATHLLLSFSLFSFIISYSTSYSCLIHSFKFYLSTIFSHILDKNCIFLIFNGILVFLAKTSGLMRFSPTKSELNEPLSNSFIEKEVFEGNMKVGEENHILNLILEDKEMDIELEDGPKREEKRDVYNVQDVEEYELELVNTDKEEDREDNELLSSEDLNKKFDDFIRKMKEEFRSGVQQHLVMA